MAEDTTSISPSSSSCSASVSCFLRDKGLSEAAIEKMLQRCPRLQQRGAEARLQQNWAFLGHQVGVPERKLPAMASRCPQLLVLALHEKFNCLAGLGAKPSELASAIARFPRLLVHSVEEKLCPLLAFLEAAGVSESRITKVLLSCPRLLSYSLQTKLQPTVTFLSELGITPGHAMGMLITRWPNIFGYSVGRRLRPTMAYLKSLGLGNDDIMNVAIMFPHILCRDAERALQPKVEYMHSLGFDSRQITSLICGHPPILLASIKNSLQPKMNFLLNNLGRRKEDVVEYPAYFAHSLSRRIQPRYRKLQQDGIYCSLENMLSCNQKKFLEWNLNFGPPTGKLANLMLTSG